MLAALEDTIEEELQAAVNEVLEENLKDFSGIKEQQRRTGPTAELKIILCLHESWWTARRVDWAEPGRCFVFCSAVAGLTRRLHDHFETFPERRGAPIDPALGKGHPAQCFTWVINTFKISIAM